MVNFVISGMRGGTGGARGLGSKWRARASASSTKTHLTSFEAQSDALLFHSVISHTCLWCLAGGLIDARNFSCKAHAAYLPRCKLTPLELERCQALSAWLLVRAFKHHAHRPAFGSFRFPPLAAVLAGDLLESFGESWPTGLQRSCC